MSWTIYYKDGSKKEFESLCGADLRDADLRDADLRGANLCGANLCGADLRGAKNSISPIDFLAENFEHTADGIIAYKTFGETYKTPEEWKIEVGSVIKETVCFYREMSCAWGINVATKRWVINETHSGEIWKCLIRWEWLPGVVVPNATDGKIRCERVELLECIQREDFVKQFAEEGKSDD
jgi:hypothetical protein